MWATWESDPVSPSARGHVRRPSILSAQKVSAEEIAAPRRRECQAQGMCQSWGPEKMVVFLLMSFKPKVKGYQVCSERLNKATHTRINTPCFLGLSQKVTCRHGDPAIFLGYLLPNPKTQNGVPQKPKLLRWRLFAFHIHLLALAKSLRCWCPKSWNPKNPLRSGEPFSPSRRLGVPLARRGSAWVLFWFKMTRFPQPNMFGTCIHYVPFQLGSQKHVEGVEKDGGVLAICPPIVAHATRRPNADARTESLPETWVLVFPPNGVLFITS